jgi:hypothetical protein
MAVDTASSVVIYKSMTYRGGTKVWGNRYHFTAGIPASGGAMDTMSDAIVTAEKAIFLSSMTIVEAVFNDASTATSTNPHGNAVHSKVYSTAGTLSGTGGSLAPGDCAGMMRYTTTQRTTKNHPIYLFNFWHGVAYPSAGPVDTVLSGQVTAYNAYGNSWLTGFSDGTTNHIQCGPRGAVAQARAASTLITHRDFPR